MWTIILHGHTTRHDITAAGKWAQQICEKHRIQVDVNSDYDSAPYFRFEYDRENESVRQVI